MIYIVPFLFLSLNIQCDQSLGEILTNDRNPSPFIVGNKSAGKESFEDKFENEVVKILSDVLVDVLSDVERCSLIFAVDDFYLRYVAKIISKSPGKEHFILDILFMPLVLFVLPGEPEKSSSLIQLSDVVKTLAKESCLHHILMMRSTSRLKEVVNELSTSLFDLEDKFIIFSNLPFTESSNNFPENYSSLNRKFAKNLLQEPPLNKIANMLLFIVPLCVFLPGQYCVDPRSAASLASHLEVHVTAFTTVFFAKGKRVQGVTFGEWSSNGFNINKKFQKLFNKEKKGTKWFPEKLEHFNGFKMKVVTFDYPPTVIFKGDNEFDGLEVRLLNTLSSSLNFGYEISEPADEQKWGTVLPNGSWTGAVGEVSRGEADISFANYFITNDKLLLVDMTKAHHIDYACFIAPIPSPPTRYLVIVWPFQSSVWITLLGFVIMLPPFAKLASFTESSVWFKSISNSFWLICGIFLGKSISHRVVPTSAPLRFIVTGTALGALVLNQAYLSSLYSLLVMPSKGHPVNSLSDILKSGLEWGVRDSGGWQCWFSGSNDPTSQKIAKGFKFVPSIEAGIARVRTGNFAFMNSGTFLRYLIASNFTDEFGQEKLHIAKECYVPFGIGYVVPKYSVYTRKFNFIIEKIVEAGLVDHWFKDLIKIATNNQKNDFHQAPVNDGANTQSSSKVLSLNDLQGAFTLLALGLLGAFFVIVMEVFVQRNSSYAFRKKVSDRLRAFLHLRK